MPDAPPSYRADPDADFADRLERVLLQRLALPTSPVSDVRRHPPRARTEIGHVDRSTDDDGAILDLDPLAVAPQRVHRVRRTTIVLGSAAAAVLVVGLAATIRTDDEPTSLEVPSITQQPPLTTLPTPAPPTTDATTAAPSASGPVEGTWVLDERDSAREMEIARAGDGYEVVVRDWSNTCPSGAPTITTRTGRLDSEGALVLERPTVTCEDGSSTAAANGSEGEPRPASVTLVYDATADTITDSTGVTWRRNGSAVWPQSSPSEVLDAQRRADAGDPTTAWQADPRLDAGPAAGPPDFAQIEIFARYLRDELGWKAFRSAAPAFDERGYADQLDGEWSEVLFIRCAAGATNVLYPNDPNGRSCAPSSDLENGYDLVGLTVRQPVRRGPTGIWVLTETISIWPYEQIVPPSDTEASALIRDFLQARVDRRPVDEHLPDRTIPNLYTTSGGSPYERFEIEELGPPAWPRGERAVTVALFADNGATVTRERFELSREPRIGGGGSLRLTPSDG